MSKRQAIVALSSAEAEYIGMTEALKSNLHFNNLLKEYLTVHIVNYVVMTWHHCN